MKQNENNGQFDYTDDNTPEKSKTKTEKKRSSITWKMFYCFAAFCIVMLGLLWLFQVVFLDEFYQSIKIKEIRDAASNIENRINDTQWDVLLENTSKRHDVCIVVIDTSGEVQYSIHPLPICLIKNTADQIRFYVAAKENGGTYMNIFGNSSQTSDNILVYTKIARKADNSELVILLSSVVSPVTATVRTLQIQLILVTSIMLFFALFLALFLSRHISKPMIQMSHSAKKLAKGDYNTHFSTEGYREISDLGEALNYASSELAKTDNLRKELIANISHDLRTPLTMISGYAEVMRDLPGENTPENVQVIIDEANRLTTLVNDALDISKLQSGTQELSVTSYCLSQSIRNIMQRYAKLTQQKGYDIQFICQEDVWIQADEVKMSQVIYNLINNAITYTGADKKVIVRQIVENGQVKIEVIDTGDGIAADKLKDIWERYYKVDKAHKRAQIGTGLGLSIVKSILQMHGAQYGVKSTLGKGSVFWFSLPTIASQQ